LTASSASTAAAVTAFVPMSSGLRRTRSASSPAPGASSDGAVKKKNTSPAWALLPVRVLTQMPIASHRLESPNSENTCPTR
jgi:hypothetical protein